MSQAISDREFTRFQRWIYDVAGIHMPAAKKALIESRLARRVEACGARSYGDYFDLVADGGDAEERQTAIDLLTTNETYFFREPKHFEFLRDYLRSNDSPGRAWRIWSAASSSGEEAYSIAMTLADVLKSDRWEVVGTDLSTRVLVKAQRAVYPMARMDEFPREYLKRYCLKGKGPAAGTMMIDRPVRSRVQFLQANLNEPLPDVGEFDVIFLRNVLIYFEPETKRQVISRVCEHLKQDGAFIVSHSESLHGLKLDDLIQNGTSIYRKRARPSVSA